MAKQETDIVHSIQLAAAPAGCVTFKNPRGVFQLKNGGMVRAGCGPNGASDLWGYVKRVIKPEDVGTTIAQFLCIEVKTPTGRVQDNQNHFIDQIRRDGGIGGICRSVQDFKELVGGICGGATI